MLDVSGYSLKSMFSLPADDGEDRSMGIGEAVRRHVRAGDVIHASHTGARPCALILQLAREFASGPAEFTFSIGGLTNTQHSLVELGLISRLVTSFAGENYPVARPSAVISRALDNGSLRIENWSLWTLTARLMAGALGLSHMPVNSLRGSTLAEELGDDLYREVRDPFGVRDQPIAAVAPLNPDIVLLHGVVGDRHGNLALAGPYGEGEWAALAARRGVIASVERFVSTEELREHAAMVQIPASAVLSISEAPMGAHPYSLNNPGFDGDLAYVEDHDFMIEVERASRESGTFREWIGRWVSGVDDHDGYVAQLGEKRLASLKAGTAPDAWTVEPDSPEKIEVGLYTSEEMMIIAAGRAIARTVKESGHDVILAGVGVANLAAWMGHGDPDASDAELVAELGIYGYEPRPGEPFVFAQRNVSTAKQLTGITGILGTLVGGSETSAIGVLGAGQVDRSGAINSTRTADGRFLVGSGGANDIATTAQEVVLTVSHGKGRLVEQVPYVTAPGLKVGTLVTTKAIFRRDSNGQLQLATRLRSRESPDGISLGEIIEGCGWPIEVTDEATIEDPPTAEELRFLRSFDPRRTFLGPVARVDGGNRAG